MTMAYSTEKQKYPLTNSGFDTANLSDKVYEHYFSLLSYEETIEQSALKIYTLS